LQRGFERLMERDYARAITDLDTARLKYVINKIGAPGAPLTPQQQMTLEGLAAAYIGQGRYEAARGPLEAAYARNVRTRSLVLNTAIYMLNTQRPIASLVQTAELVRQHLARAPEDEYAADIFGTLVNKIERMDKAPKEKVDEWWKIHDQFIDQIASRSTDPAMAGKLKWGTEWLPADDVKNYRLARGVTNPGAGVAAAAREVELAGQRRHSAQTALNNANVAKAAGKAADVQGAQSQLDAANAALVKAQQALNLANAAMNVKKPNWQGNFKPVIPEQIAAP
jgi:hypothetical protein